ncbi:MAG: NAD-dependent malic enzyme, partial [Chloroflexi bacterium]|nr:NAD-dependent malic enzyme [Chloroflexota bacterium]
TAIGKVGADIWNVETVHIGHHYTIRDIDVFLDSERHLEKLVDEISKLSEVSLLQILDNVLEVHKNGKIRMASTIQINSLDVLRRVYTPGVGEVCSLIANQPNWKYAYTIIPNSVAIVTDGTAILGLGNIGPVAGMPVMEGKAALLQELVGINGIPVWLNTTDPDEIVDTVVRISPTFGGIQLEDISSPRCFSIQARLEEELSVPVMHDDQQGTAVVVLAALINACKLSKVIFQEARIGLVGLGAAGLTIGKFLMQYTGKPVLGIARTEGSMHRLEEQGGIRSNLDELMQNSDIVIATSGVKGLIKPSMVRKGQIIFALSNPYPEITPESARAVGAALATDGKTVNNLLGYPEIWRGTLDARATKRSPTRCTWPLQLQ